MIPSLTKVLFFNYVPLSKVNLLGDARKKVDISLDKLIAIVVSDGPSPLYGIADPSRAYSQTVGQSSQEIPQFPGA